jgi:hypothetical protein
VKGFPIWLNLFSQPRVKTLLKKISCAEAEHEAAGLVKFFSLSTPCTIIERGLDVDDAEMIYGITETSSDGVQWAASSAIWRSLKQC